MRSMTGYGSGRAALGEGQVVLDVKGEERARLQVGDLMANSLMALYPTVQRLRPPLHDWNDTLRAQA